MVLAFGVVGQLGFDGLVKVGFIQAVLHHTVFFKFAQGVGIGQCFADLACVLQNFSVCGFNKSVQACFPILHGHGDIALGLGVVVFAVGGSYPEIPDNCLLL